jgi:putative oxidoreductase
MAAAYWWVHAPGSVFPLLSGGEGALLYCFAFLYLAAAGGGTWSLDALKRR